MLYYVLLFYAKIHCTKCKVWEWAAALSLHEDLCEKNVPERDGYPPKNSSSTQEYPLPLTIKSNFELVICSAKWNGELRIVNLVGHLDDLGHQSIFYSSTTTAWPLCKW